MIKNLSNRTLSLALLLILSACSTASETTALKKRTQGIVVTANPHATKAGADVLRAGGSAVDAAIAIEAVLSLVEPQSSGLAGGGFMTYFDNRSKQVMVYDGRERAPASVSVDLFLDQQGKPMGFIDAKTSGISTGVPGMVSLLQLAHQDHGKLPWAAAFNHAKQLAKHGFEISPRLHGMIKRFGRFIPSEQTQGPVDAYQYFFDDQGEPKPVGYRLKNLDYARTLDLIAKDPRSFYTGKIAQQIIDQVQTEPRAGGMELEDLANYSAQRREAICTPYKQQTLCGPPPPSSWLAVGQIMGLLQHASPYSDDPKSNPDDWASFAQAQKLAYADRDHYVADNKSVNVPIQGLLNPQYLLERAKLLSADHYAQVMQPGDPWAYDPGLKKVAGIDATNDVAGTTHFVVVDGDGNAVSLTASVESVFGSTRMAGGMFLNNQMTDFSFRPQDEKGQPIANAVAAGKRPRSSMSPTIVLDSNNEFLMATGSPGGNSIIAYTAKTLLGVLDWGLTPQQAIELPNVVARGDSVRIEQTRATPEFIYGMRQSGFNVKESAGENSGLSVVYKQADGRYLGAADPRREGVVEVVELD